MSSFVRTMELPTSGARTLPGRFFSSQRIFDLEMDRIFTQRWLCIGRSDRIAEPGAYLLQAVGPESIIVLRDKSGQPRAYYNVCRHRGTRMCEQKEGRFSETIQCPYHAWTYALDGRLLAAPSSDTIDGFSKADYPLHRVGTAEWEGWLFINLTPDGQSFDSAFAPVIGRFSRYGLPELTVARRIEYDVKANWKLVVQNYQECYHCAPVHPALTKLSPPTSGEMDLHEGPFLGGYMTLVDGAETLSFSGRACGLPVSGDLPDEDHRRVYYYSLFPNMLLSLHHDYVMAHTLWPLGPDHTYIECEWLFNPKSLDNPAFDPEDGITFWDRTNREDWHVCELSQRGVSSRSYVPGPYSRRESITAAFDQEVLRSLGEDA